MQTDKESNDNENERNDNNSIEADGVNGKVSSGKIGYQTNSAKIAEYREKIRC